MDPKGWQAKYRGALVGTAVGDALGAPFEGHTAVILEDVERVLESDRPLQYTDDTHMTLAMAVSLIERRGFDGEHMAHTFARFYASEPWRGYGSGPPRIFRAIAGGAPWDQPARELFGGAGSYGNGAAMRVAPAALFAGGQVQFGMQLARQTGAITHMHELGLEGAALQAAALCLILQQPNDAPLNPLAFIASLKHYITNRNYLEKLQSIERLLPNPTSDAVVSELGNGIAAVEAVPAAVCAFLRTPTSFDEVIRFALSLGGDVDTIAAMAGALSACHLGEDAIPAGWVERSEGFHVLQLLADGVFELAVDSRANE